MADNYFIDTNIWLYGFMKGDERHKTASLLISGENIVLGTQVLNEICFNLIRKAGYDEVDIAKFIKNMYRRFDILKPSEEIILTGSLIRKKYQINYWESIKISTALKNSCKVMFTDNVKNGLIIEDSLKIINPFES